jgi:Mrp family chromosome partitioning ATPase
MSLSNVKNVILVLSGKGGVGKSSITTQLALSLSLLGLSVGILDVDLTGPSIPRLLGIEGAKVRQAPEGWLPVLVHDSQALPDLSSTVGTNGTADVSAPSDEAARATQAPRSVAGPVHAMSLAFLLATRSSAIVWRGPKKTAMIRQFLTSVLWPPIDYLLIDTPPGTSDEHISLVEALLKDVVDMSASANGVNGHPGAKKPNLAGAVVVTTPQAVAISDVRKEINFCAKTGVPVIGVVENMSGYVCECCGVSTNLFSKGGGELMAREFGVRFLGAVPVDSQWGLLVEEGRRPRYEAIQTRSVGDGEEGGKDPEEPPDAEVESRDDAPLVDKYRHCSLWTVFQEIAKQVVHSTESGLATRVPDTA